MSKKEEYNPYCKSCDSCGEDPCCSYLSCVFSSIDKNKQCDYPETYKKELLLRNKFMNLAFKMAITDEEKKFIDAIYDASYDEVFKK